MSLFDLWSNIRYRMWVAKGLQGEGETSAVGGSWVRQVVIAAGLVLLALTVRTFVSEKPLHHGVDQQQLAEQQEDILPPLPVQPAVESPTDNRQAAAITAAPPASVMPSAAQPAESEPVVPAAAAPATGGGQTSPVAENLVATAAPRAQEPVPARETALEHAAKHADPTYVCPMHPSVQSKDPNATCPICGMDLVLVESGGEADVVTLSPNVINMLGVRTDKVKKRNLYRKIDTVGYVTYDENRIYNVSLRTEGWLERMAVKAVGERVEKGQLLFELYSPKLVNAQEEYLQAMTTGNESLIAASRDRLAALGVADSQINRLAQTHIAEHLVKVYAPQSGIVQSLQLREGSFVPPATAVLTLSDISKVWLVANVFERQADWVAVNDRATASLPFYPDKSWEGMVDYVYPSLDAKTRSLQVRLLFDNAGEQLKPNMYADVQLYAQPKKKTLAIPREALIRTGSSDRVIVALGGGRFKPVTVSTGIETDAHVEILGGLQEGEEIVTSSQFLIDSESSLRASVMRLGGK